jgi:hypothetical protein
MSVPQALAVFIGLPVLLYAIVAVFVYGPAQARGPKYRPGLSWWAQPVWISGGDVSAVAAAEPITESGGSSARW